MEHVSATDLNKSWGDLVNRVLRGERFIVCRHGRPVATMQPLDGAVLVPGAAPTDVMGDLLFDVPSELDKLSDLQQELLRDHIQLGRIVTSGLTGSPSATERAAALQDLELRGLARHPRGWGTHLTARGLMLREALLRAADIDPFRCYFGRPTDPTKDPLETEETRRR